MIRKSRMVVALGLALALGVAALAFADGASEATPTVIGEIEPTKQDAKKFKDAEMTAGVATDLVVDGNQQNPEAELIQFDKDIRFNFQGATLCTAPLGGTTTDQAKATCPPKSNIGGGDATVKLSQSQTISDEVVTVFAGPENNQVRLHAYSPTLQASNTQVIQGFIVNAPDAGFKQALSVPDAPDAGGDVFAITSFKATITKSSGVVEARCKVKGGGNARAKKGTYNFKREVTYDDGSKETVETTDTCKPKKKRRN